MNHSRRSNRGRMLGITTCHYRGARVIDMFRDDQEAVLLMNGTPIAETATPIDSARYEVVLVTYYSRGELAGLLGSVHPDQRLVVVDNASGADGVEEIVRQFPHGRWLDGGNS